MISPDEYTENLHLLENYFTQNSSSAFYFGVINDELLQQEINEKIQFVLQGKNKKINVFSWKNNVQTQHPIQALHDFVAANPTTKGLLINDLEAALFDNPDLWTQLNFGREWMSELNIPLFFWLKKESLALIAQKALDLYDQRIGSPIFYERLSEITDTNHQSEHYILERTLAANKDLEQYKARIKSLQSQLAEAEKQNWPKERIANEIVIDLLGIYARIPRTHVLIKDLLSQYLSFMDLESARICFFLGFTYEYLRQLNKAEKMYQQSVKFYRLEGIKVSLANVLNNLALLQFNQNGFEKSIKNYKESLVLYRDLSKKNPQNHLPGVAMVLHNLALLQYHQNKFQESMRNYKESLNLYRNLSKENPQIYLPDVAMTLNNLASLQADKYELEESVKSYEEALNLYRDLSKNNPQTYLPDVAMILNNLGILYEDKKEYSKAEPFYLEAFEIYLQFARFMPQVYEIALAMTTINLSFFYLEDKIDKSKSIHFAQKTIELCQKYIEKQHPQAIDCSADAKEILAEWEAKGKKNS